MKRRHLPTFGVLALALAGSVALGRAALKDCPSPQTRTGLICLEPQTSSVPADPNATPSGSSNTDTTLAEIEDRFSVGDHILFTAEGNLDSKAGAKAIASQDYPQAIISFKSAVASSRNKPEPQIYLNNAIAREKGNPYTLAVVVPIENNSNEAQDILRGVADAQTQFNDAEGVDNRLLEIIIVNDGNEPEIAAKVAARLTKTTEVLGVIGHNSSSASLKALPEYEAANLPMVSPTSTSTELVGDVFFRTVPSDTETGKKLADYVERKIEPKKVSIFFDSNSTYSKSLLKAFKDGYEGNIFSEVDLAKNLNFGEEVKKISPDVTAVLLFPSTETVSRAIGIALANFDLPQANRFQLLGGDALYKSETLVEGGQAIEGLVLAVPWFANTAYAKQAEKRWGGQVSWRTASSYDATKALTQAMSKEASRGSVLTAIRKVQIKASETSGNLLTFEDGGNRVEQPLLVRATKGGNAPENSKFGFELIQ